MIKKLLSYIIPITISNKKSSISQPLEITLMNGKLQRILRTGLKNIGFKKINKMSQILVLGVAGGSVIKT